MPRPSPARGCCREMAQEESRCSLGAWGAPWADWAGAALRCGARDGHIAPLRRPRLLMPRACLLPSALMPFPASVIDRGGADPGRLWSQHFLPCACACARARARACAVGGGWATISGLAKQNKKQAPSY